MLNQMTKIRDDDVPSDLSKWYAGKINRSAEVSEVPDTMLLTSLIEYYRSPKTPKPHKRKIFFRYMI